MVVVGSGAPRMLRSWRAKRVKGGWPGVEDGALGALPVLAGTVRVGMGAFVFEGTAADGTGGSGAIWCGLIHFARAGAGAVVIEMQRTGMLLVLQITGCWKRP